MKLNTITIAVTDIERTIAFYRAIAQLKVIRRFNPGQGEIAFMADREGDTALEFVQRPELEPVRATGLTLR
ncbi:MAG: VOC family protein, partial [Clostridia bacterium]|nr:VOC family protein [Clostridia bacterium]